MTEETNNLRRLFLNNKLSLNDIEIRLKKKGYSEKRIKEIRQEILFNVVKGGNKKE